MARARGKKREDAPTGPPMWIVSFTDMVTLLLSFFVMLQALARRQDEELFHIGQGSFIRAIEGLGIPKGLFGKAIKIKQRYRKVKHPTKPAEEEIEKHRVIDAESERIVQLFAELRAAMDTVTTDTTEQAMHVTATNISFKRSQATLDAPAKTALRQFARSVRQNLRMRRIKIYVIGLAPDEGGSEQQWVVSARRAQAAERFLRNALSSDLRTGAVQLRWVGAGAGGRWRLKSDPSPGRSFLYIAVVRGGEDENG